MARVPRRQPESEDWAEKLKELRKLHELTQQEAADKIAVSQSVWSAWERGAKVPSESMKRLINLTFPKKS